MDETKYVLHNVHKRYSKKKYQDKYDINLRNVIVYVYVTL